MTAKQCIISAVTVNLYFHEKASKYYCQIEMLIIILNRTGECWKKQ